MTTNIPDVSSLWRAQTSKSDGQDKSISTTTAEESTRLSAFNRSTVEIYELLMIWPRWQDKMMFLAGFSGQMTCAVTSALVISKTVRERFFVTGAVSGLMSGFAATALASALTMAANDRITVANLMKATTTEPTCFTCIQSRQALANLGTSILIPAVLLIPDTLYHAARDPSYGTLVPHATEYRRVAQFVWEKYRGPVMRRISLLALANIMVAYAGTYLEMRAVSNIVLLAEDDPSLLTAARSKRSGMFAWIQDRVNSLIGQRG